MGVTPLLPREGTLLRRLGDQKKLTREGMARVGYPDDDDIDFDAEGDGTSMQKQVSLLSPGRGSNHVLGRNC